MSIELILIGDLLTVVEWDSGEEPSPLAEEGTGPPSDARAIGEAELVDWVRLRVATA